MAIRFECPTCGSTIEASETHAGVVKECPSCKELIRVPFVSQRSPGDVKQTKAPEVAAPAELKPVSAPVTAQGEKKVERKKTERDPRVASVTLVTTDTVAQPGYRLTRTYSMIRAQRVLGAKFFRDLLVATRDTSGGRDELAEKLFQEVDAEVLYDLQEQAFALGANAVAEVRIQHVDISGKSEVFYVAAQGTPVLLEKAESGD